ncbi:MAG: viroplasmin family protein [Lacibacter sp.]|jgi:ribonuclease HI
MKKKKYYVVWKGRQPGIYDNWDDCRKQVEGFAGAAYKAFESHAAAETAFQQPPAQHIFKKAATEKKEKPAITGGPIQDSIVVDAAWNSVQKDMEYQGIYYKTGKKIFHSGPHAHATNNIGEFLAIVHALAYCQKHGLTDMPIYSDSRNAIKWVQEKKCKTNLEQNAKTAHIFNLIHRAEAWLQQHPYQNKILKWETEAWGENPADFGRK